MFFTIISTFALMLYAKTSTDNKFKYEKQMKIRDKGFKCKAYGI